MFSVNTFWFYWYVLIGLQSLIKHQVEDWLKRVHQFLDTWQRRSCSFLLLIIRFERHRLWWKRQCFGDSLKIGWLNSNTCVENFFFCLQHWRPRWNVVKFELDWPEWWQLTKFRASARTDLPFYPGSLICLSWIFFLYIRKDVLDSL